MQKEFITLHLWVSNISYFCINISTGHLNLYVFNREGIVSNLSMLLNLLARGIGGVSGCGEG